MEYSVVHLPDGICATYEAHPVRFYPATFEPIGSVYPKRTVYLEFVIGEVDDVVFRKVQ